MSWERQITIKTPDELEIMRTAGRINAEALFAVHALIKPGVATVELNEAAEAVHRKYGVYSPFKNYPGPTPFPASICVSINDVLVHGIPGKYRLKEGDIVSVDCGTVYEGFVGDSAFTAGVGKLDPQAQKLLNVTEQALYAGIDRMRADNHVGDVSAAIQDLVEKNGFHITREYTGHGVGRKMHEGPQVPNYGTPGRGMKLRPGITVALEPMVLVSTPSTRVQKDKWAVASLDGSLTAHFEHSIAVTQNGPYILTRLEDDSSPGQIAGQLINGVL
jgi:methionyl aminopeptidase